MLSLGRIDCTFELLLQQTTWRIEVHAPTVLSLIFICVFAGTQSGVFLPVAGFVCTSCLLQGSGGIAIECASCVPARISPRPEPWSHLACHSDNLQLA